MHLFWGWNIKISSLFLLVCVLGMAQENALPIKDFKNKKVLYLDAGYHSAPFNIDCPVGGENVTFKYKNNFRALLGIGFAYKWFHLRIGFPILNYVRNVQKWGQSRQFSLGFNFTVKKLFCDFDFNTVQGYAIQNYGSIDSSYTATISQLSTPGVGTTNFSLNSWYFNNRDFKMSALRGIQAHYNEPVHTWYIKATTNIFGVDNNSSSILPSAILEVNNDQIHARTLYAFDFGILPGYAYVNRIKNWQFSAWLGLGGVVQSKFYFSGENRGFLGLAPRYDIRLLGGYSNDKFFTFAAIEFDNKSIRFSDLKYNLYSHSVKIIGGLRL